MTAPPGPIATMRPAYITATRSAVSAITPMSCVTSITAVPCSRVSRFSNWIICDWIDTSSAVVGSFGTGDRALGRPRLRERQVRADRLDELATDRVERVERRQRILEHGADLAPAQ